MTDHVVVSLSGGKDSVYALFSALKEGLDVKHLMFIQTGGKAHLENKHLIGLISEATGIPAIIVGKNSQDISKALKKLGATMLVSGVTTTPEHLDYYRDILDPIGVKQYAPLFGKDPINGLEEMYQKGFRCLIIEVDTSLGANKEWLGKVMDQNIINEIKQRVAEKKINPIGEWGEYHTLVIDCPIYKKQIKIEKDKTEWRGTKGYYIIKKASLQLKFG
ncbi:MAG: diphthine--ammonia ligase [Candidatus Bathyarchaeota archaeon]|nr:diphthine--ammonia ligase [Candidatus Termiticorpusculum sp.]